MDIQFIGDVVFSVLVVAVIGGMAYCLSTLRYLHKIGKSIQITSSMLNGVKKDIDQKSSHEEIMKKLDIIKGRQQVEGELLNNIF